jgi:CRISPR system Cascade subunit CasE
MYLTKIVIDNINILQQRLFDVYRWKQALYKAFSPVEEDTRPFLFDIRSKSDQTQVLVLSEKAPRVLPFGTWQTKSVSPDFYAGTRYVFEVTANPTMKQALLDDQGTKKRQGKRIGLQPARYEEWLRRKLEDAGCSVVAAVTENLGLRVCQRKGVLVSHSAARFKGVLSVKDPLKFREVAVKGIGTARGFGFGMLLLKRI